MIAYGIYKQVKRQKEKKKHDKEEAQRAHLAGSGRQPTTGGQPAFQSQQQGQPSYPDGLQGQHGTGAQAPVDAGQEAAQGIPMQRAGSAGSREGYTREQSGHTGSKGEYVAAQETQRP